jgi:glycosyltransferase involved in cell wall biosynthesis
MPKISILSPTYNHEKYISQAIKSVLNQTVQDFELIIADDASSDSTVEKILEFDDKRLTLLLNEKNQGTVETSRHCWQQSTGQYITMLATDDIYEPDMLETLSNFLDANPEALAVFGSAHYIDEDGTLLPDGWTNIGVGKDRFMHLQQLFKLQHPFCSIAGMFRRTTLENFGYFPSYLRQTNDMAHHIKMLFHGPMPIIPNKVLRYRWRADNANVSSRTPENDARLDFELFAILDLYREHIDSIELLRTVFPEVEQHPWPLEESLISFHIAQIAISFGYPSHKLYGLHLLYQLLRDETIASHLRERCNFTYTDFFILAGKQPVIMDFGIYNRNNDLNAKLDALNYELKTIKTELADVRERLDRVPISIVKFFGKTRRVAKLIKQGLMN